MFLTTLTAFSQLPPPDVTDTKSHLEVKASLIGKKAKGEYVSLMLEFKIENGWHLYAHNSEEGGPIPLSIEFTNSEGVSKIEKLFPNRDPHEKYDDIFEVTVRSFKKRVVYSTKVKVKDPNFKINVKVEGQVCSDKTGQCIKIVENLVFE